MLERPSACPQAHSVAFLFSVSVLHSYCTRPLIACFGLSRGEWVSTCVAKKLNLWCCMQPSYDASKGKKRTRWQDVCLLYFNAICKATLHPSLTKHICLNGVVQWRSYFQQLKWGVFFSSFFRTGAFITVTHMQALHYWSYLRSL